MTPQLGKLGVTAGHEPLARIVGVLELDQVAFIKEIGLDRLIVYECADRGAF